MVVRKAILHRIGGVSPEWPALTRTVGGGRQPCTSRLAVLVIGAFVAWGDRWSWGVSSNAAGSCAKRDWGGPVKFEVRWGREAVGAVRRSGWLR